MDHESRKIMPITQQFALIEKASERLEAVGSNCSGNGEKPQA